MESTIYSDELQHHGVLGMKWGVRRYQNADGTLTAAGQKRYNKEVEKLKKETAKVEEAEKAAANRKKTQSKFDKLNAKKQALEERKKALKEDSGNEKNADTPEETVEQRRERLLKSTNAKELYEGKDDLTYQELNDRINRIDLESKLQSRIPIEEEKTVLDRMDDASNAIRKVANLYKSVDDAYSTIANSAIGKTLAKQLGIETPTKGFDPEEFIQKVRNNKATAQEIETGSKALKNLDSIEQEMNRRANKKKADEDYRKQQEEAVKEAKAAEARKKEAQKQVDEYNKRWQKGESDDTVSERKTSTYGKSGDDITDNKTATGKGSKANRIGIEQGAERAKTDGKVYGEGTSRRSSSSKNDTVIDLEEGVDYRYVNPKTSSTPMSNVTSTSAYITGRRVAGLLGVSDNPNDSSKSSSNPTNPSGSRSSQSEDYNDRIRKAADTLSKAAKNSTDAVNKAKTGKNIVDELLKRNDDLLNGRK